MAQLGNLLVKGSSRFLNKAYFEDVSICGDVSIGGKLDITANEGKSILSLNGKKALEVYDTWLNINESRDFPSGIYCGTGVLRTDGEFQVSNIKTGVKFKVDNSFLTSNVTSTFNAQTTFNGGLIASSANISEEICNTLIVKDELRSAKWNIDNITNLGSTFYVSPCIIFTNPSVYVNSISGTTVVLTITDNSITSSTIGGATWTNGSKVKLMGRIGNSALGTINGVLKRDLNSSTAKTAYISLDFPNTDLIKFSAGATYSGSDVVDLKMMMYEVNKNVNGTTKNRPIGILLSSYGENKKPCIDIYNGDIEDGSPVARMGYLNGLPSVDSVSPTGYGFYAAGNAYFSGTLVSSSGKIGGFSLSENSIQNGAFGQSGSVLICTGTNSYASIGGSDSINGWCFTSGNTFGVTKTGELYATSGKIGGFNIDSTFLQSSDETVGLSATSYNWAFWAGGASMDTAKFRVNQAGKLWASNATIAGEITATSGKIGKYTIDNYLSTGSGYTCTGMGGNQAFWAGSESSNDAPFHVSYDGSFYSSKGKIAGWEITSDSFYKDTDDYTVYVCPGTNNNKDFLTVHDKNKSSGDEWPFYVHADGWMHCVYGDIGGWNIGKNSINSSYSNTETTEYYVSDSFYSLSILSDSSKIISEFNEKKYSDSSKQKILSSESDSLTISGDSVQGTSKYILYGEETDKSGYSFLLSAYNGLEILNEVSEEGISYTGNHILFTRYNETVAEITEDKINSCHAGEVCHYYGNNYRDCGTNNDKYCDLSAFTTGEGKTFGSFHTKMSNEKIKINRTGVYCFQVRFSVNSGVKGSADKRVEFVPFVNNTRQARYAASFSSRGNFSITNFQTYILSLNKGDVIAFDISPIEKVSVRVQIVDISVHVLDYVNKYAYEYN